MPVETTICRVCHAQCPAYVTVENGRATHLTGVKDDPVYHGYACAKGRALPSYHYMPERLRTSLRKNGGGSHEAIGSAAACREVADRLAGIIDAHGPRAVAFYNGTHGYNNFLTTAFAFSFMEAIGSPMLFTSVTIDQPGKAVSGALHGTWLAGNVSIEQADCWMFVGANPVVSMLGPVNPAHALKRNLERGMSLIVIDPRRTEVARRAHVHLQPRPGNDSLLLAAMLKIVFDEALHDQAFLTQHVDGVDALRRELAAIDVGAVAAAADVAANDISCAARLYAAGRRGVAAVGTGPNMAGNGNLTEYLSRVLMSVCGHWLQAGETFYNPGVYLHPLPPLAQAAGPMPAWGFGEKLRVRGLADTAAGLPTAALSDEILLEGDGRVRALIVAGGNPMLAWPDQLKTQAALDKLDLLVCLDTVQSATGAVADYVIATKTHLEMAGVSALQEACRAYIGWGYWAPYGQYCRPVIAPPDGADVIEDWEFFYDVARTLDKPLSVKPMSYAFYPDKQAELAFTPDFGRKPTTDELYDRLFVDSPVAIDDIRAVDGGAVFEREPVTVQTADPASAGRLDAGNPDMLGELRALSERGPEAMDDYPFRLVSRRLPDIVNSSWRPNPVTLRRWPHNPAFMNPDDIDELGLANGDRIVIRSARAEIGGIVEVAPDVRRGVVSMTHCWGGAPGDTAAHGSNTGKLTANDELYDPHTGIPRMSAIPVSVRAAGGTS